MDKRRFLITGGLALATPSLLLAAAPPLKLREFYNKDGSFSDLALERVGQRITVMGFMAPPLKADSQFFVLTKKPLAVCPFCETEADWPDDIIAVYMRRKYRVISFSRKIETTGTLALGRFRDPETGFLSMARIEHAKFEVA